MENPAGVRESNRIADAHEDTQAIWNGRKRLNVSIEALAFDKLHGVKDAAICKCAGIMYGNNSGMVKAGQHTRLAQQTVGEVAFVAGNFEHFFDHFERNATLQELVFRCVDDTHASARYLLDEAVARAAQIGKFGTVAQAGQRFVGEMSHRSGLSGDAVIEPAIIG